MTTLYEHARNNLGAYHLATHPNYEVVRFQQEIMVPALHEVATHRIRALMILMPYRHSKTDLGTLSFLAWLTGKWPDRKNMCLSYSDKFAKRFGHKIVELVKGQAHGQIFPDCSLSPAARSGSYFTTTAGGEFYSAGFNGTITGQGVTGCLAAESLVTTEAGPLSIDKLVQLIDRPRVLSYNHEKQCCEWRRVIAACKTREVDKLVVIGDSKARGLRATEDHLIWAHDGYRQAATITPGWELCTLAPALPMRSMRRTERWARLVLPSLLSGITYGAGDLDMPYLWGRIRAFAIRIRQIIASRMQSVLFPALCEYPGISSGRARTCSPYENGQLQILRSGDFEESKLLWGELSYSGSPVETESANEEVSSLWRRILSALFEERVLQRYLCEPFSQYAYAGQRQFSLQGWSQLCEIVRGDEGAGLRARSMAMRDLLSGGDLSNSQMERQSRSTDQFSRTPYQPESAREQSREPDYAMQDLSCGIAQVTRSAVGVIGIERCRAEPVYDITVEGNHNFFANGILVHNCLVIDDPIKNLQEATSAPIIERRMEDYRSAAGTRLEGGSKCLITNRWCSGDFVDRVLDEEGEVSEGGQWTVMQLQAEAGEDDPLGRAPGEYLWPERLGNEWYEDQKKQPRIWNSMCQQDPKKNTGKYFKKDWLCFYPKPVRPGRFPAYMLTDPARATGKHNDRTCCIVFVTTPERRILIVDAVLSKLDPGQRGQECIRLLRKWRPKRWLYEEYGLLSDTWYLEQEAKKAGIHIRPIPVGRKGPRHIMSKEARIESLIPDFREGRIWLPDIWGDQGERRPPVPFATMMDDSGHEPRERNIIEYFLNSEYVEYAGENSVPNDDMLDTLDRIHESECGIVFPSATIVEVGRSMTQTRAQPRSWETLL